MGSCANAELFFGAISNDDYSETNMELPWDYEDEDKPNEANDWWCEVNGKDFREDDGTKDYIAMVDWLKESPCPLRETGVGDACDGFTQTAIYLAGTRAHSSWCDNITDHLTKQKPLEELVKEFRDLCDKYGIDLSECSVGWQIGAMYG